ncbi:DUF4012 domain-containing protein [uncultured Aeromicrobium sp.]|uniref:DUF4012 domain-containing protein n=1 Tax=uncultured Aeromicrobium sp. TaxID=337820 RepID=UPI0025D833DC|nr:DUF4012 domain-containing protein [uncultured Aeromicrobium sp.]
MTNPLLPPSARSAGRAFVWVLFAAVAVAVVCAAWLGVRGYLAYGHVRDAQQTVREIRANVTDTQAASSHAAELADHTAAARSLTSDPVWRAAEHLPWAGDQLEAVATTIEVVDEVASSALGPLVDVAQDFSVEDLRPAEGRINVEALASVRDVAATSAERVVRAADRIEGIDRRPLLGPVAEQIDEVGEQLRSAGTGADAIARASQLMPAMLGQDGPREYLLLFQNNAEWRSLGGIVGATAVLRTEQGVLSLQTQASSGDFERYVEPVLPLDESLRAIFADQPALFIQNVTQVPMFPTTAQLAQAIWERESGQRVNGVIAVDPVTLAYLLEATGPITLPTGDVVTAENAVSLLLNEVYLRYEDPALQDAFFQATAAAVFDAVARGSADPGALIDALRRATGEHRILVWNENENEQVVLDGTALQGLLPPTDADRTAFGVYLNDGTASKMNFYSQLSSGASWCSTEGGGSEAVLAVTLRNDAPADAASLPRYITGGGVVVPPGVTRTVAYLYLPEGAQVVSASDATGGGFGTAAHAGRTVLTWETNLAPGESTTATVRVSAPWTPELDVVTTPTIPGAAETTAPACPASP